jgi:hypothetical protein
VNQSKHRQGFVLIVVISTAAFLFAMAQLITRFNNLAVYNIIRATAFALYCIYLHRNPTKINFIGPLEIGDEGNASDLNIKISYFCSYLFTIFNLAISIALYFDS